MSDYVHRLNKLLCGTQVAIETYDRYLGDMKDKKIINSFKDYRRQYDEYSDELCRRIDILGGTPKKTSGSAGKMAEMTYRMKKHDVTALLKSAYKGEKTAVKASEKILSEGLDPTSAELVGRRIAMARENASEIRREIEKLESRGM